MAQDALGLLDALAIERAHLVGRSMGGMIAQIIAASNPERTLSLTSIMATTGNPALPPPAPEIMAMLMGPTPDPISDEAAFLRHRLAFARRIAAPGLPSTRRSIARRLWRNCAGAGGRAPPPARLPPSRSMATVVTGWPA
jgi:pimeloyl-ACP methyl ester carboxylesterase